LQTGQRNLAKFSVGNVGHSHKLVTHYAMLISYR